MDVLLKILIGIVALEHLYFLYFEMFAWETIGKKSFKAPYLDYFKHTKSLAANQGLYNGFLAAGIIWTFFIEDKIWQSNVLIFFLSCVIIAGIFGAFTVSKRIFYIQSVPAILALGCLFFISR